jgi:hypothetical protein
MHATKCEDPQYKTYQPDIREEPKYCPVYYILVHVYKMSNWEISNPLWTPKRVQKLYHHPKIHENSNICK